MIDMSDVTVVVTRPAHQTEALCQLIEATGAMALPFPVIEIQPPINIQQAKEPLMRLDSFNLVIFISTNAVNMALRLLPKPYEWPKNTMIAAVGQATADVIQTHGLTISMVAPEPYNSEALLSTAELQKMEGQSVLIIRGCGGREYLAEMLRQRGAMVEYAERYQRIRPQSDMSLLKKVWDKNQNMIFVVTSNEGLENLVQMIGDKYQPALLSSTIIVLSKRTANFAKDLGFTEPAILTKAASNDAILTSIKVAVGE